MLTKGRGKGPSLCENLRDWNGRQNGESRSKTPVVELEALPFRNEEREMRVKVVFSASEGKSLGHLPLEEFAWKTFQTETVSWGGNKLI